MFEVGDFVIKNPNNWTCSEFENWGRGIGIGEIRSIEYIDIGDVDVHWPAGNCYENINELLKWELTIDELIKRPIISTRHHDEVFNKMSDDEYTCWEKLMHRRISKQEPRDFASAYLAAVIDYVIMYDIIKMNYPEHIIRNDAVDFFNY
jgi:hypothetical protein